MPQDRCIICFNKFVRVSSHSSHVPSIISYILSIISLALFIMTSTSRMECFMKSVLQLCIVVVVIIHVALMALGHISWLCGIWGLALQIMYAKSITHFPYVQVRSPLFLATCGKTPTTSKRPTSSDLTNLLSGALWVHKWLWYDSILKQLEYSSTPALVFSTLCLWMVPLLLWVSLNPDCELDLLPIWCPESVCIAPSPPRSPLAQAMSSGLGVVNYRSPRGRTTRMIFDPECTHPCVL